MSDYPMLISNKLHSFRNFSSQNYKKYTSCSIPKSGERLPFLRFYTDIWHTLKIFFNDWFLQTDPGYPVSFVNLS